MTRMSFVFAAAFAALVQSPAVAQEAAPAAGLPARAADQSTTTAADPAATQQASEPVAAEPAADAASGDATAKKRIYKEPGPVIMGVDN